MKRIILQHWAGELTEVVTASSQNIERYATQVGADYRLLRKYPFSKRLTPPCQKLHMLAEEFDDYDVVVMLDADMFTPVGMAEDVFELKGVGWNHKSAHRRVMGCLPELTSAEAPFWGGAIYRLEHGLRRLLRAEIDDQEMQQFTTREYSEDEGIMHRLAMRAGIPVKGAYIDQRWCQASFAPNPLGAAIIHMRSTVRNRPGYPGNGRDKTANFHHFKAQGVIE